MSSIFINIAAYHDYELTKTINNLIEESSGQNELHFGVHYVFEDEDNIQIPKLDNITYIASKAPANLGVGTGRYLAHTLYDNEDYYLQIDSHTRVDKNWDKTLIEDIDYYKGLGFKKPLITAYPAQYWYENGEEKRTPDPHPPQNIKIITKDADQIKATSLNGNRHCVFDEDIKQDSISGGFCFGPGPFVEFNKDISFSEEFILGAMLYTNGYDLLIPRSLVVYHYYSAAEKGSFEEFNRRSVWHYPKNDKYLYNCASQSHKTILKILRERLVGKNYLGKERTLESYGQSVGLLFDRKKLI